MRIALGVQYDGSTYHGWQRQKDPDLLTLQVAIEQAISQVANHPIEVTSAGRTDAGVHAAEQVLHFDTTAERSEMGWVKGANCNLPHEISVLWSKVVDEHFHARYSATARRYHYIIYNNRIRPTYARHYTSWQYRHLDAELMHQAAQYLLGEHDFSSFRSVACQAKTPNRHLHEIAVHREGDYLLLNIKANAFLHHMVRNIAGALMEVGYGKHEATWIKELLELRDRTLGGITAPPNGLYLVDIEYPQIFQLPSYKTSDNTQIFGKFIKQ
jgi:tRNA pseudouridine38-40 synthase